MAKGEKKGGIEDLERKISQTLLFLFPTIIIIFYFVFRETDFRVLFATLNYRYFALLFVLMVVIWLVNALKFSLIVLFSKSRISFKKSFKILLASIFGANITPFYSGGAPTQVYFLSKFSRSIGRAVAISAIYMILTLIVYLVFSLVLFFAPRGFITGVKQYFFMGLAAFVFFLSFFAFFFMRFPKKAEKLINWIYRVLLRKGDRAERIKKGISEFSEGLDFFLSQNKFSIVVTILLTLPFSFWEVVLTQIAVQFTTSVGASPGGIGVMEGAFAAFFRSIAGGRVAQITLLWRSTTFYIPTLVGAFFFYRLLREKGE
jgi:uncharacterized protein (TIRG00374 family)